MRHLSPIVAVVVTAVLALLLVAYVFAGGTGDKAEARARCSSRQAYDQVKGELFRRAAALRGSDQAAFAKVARYTVVRMTSPAHRGGRGSGAVTCSGSLALDLPPGVEVVGGRRSVTGKVAYALERGRNRTVRLRALGNAEPLVALLSTLVQTGSQGGELLMPAGEPAPQAAATPPQSAAPAPTADNAAPPPSAAPRPTANPPATRPAAPPPQPRPAAAAKPPIKPKAQRAANPSAPAPARSATARPSFNCRYARTRGEVALCNDSGLANLDRLMAAQFFRALAAANPAQRALLQTTRSRFLRYRDSCGTRACMVEAYQGRMREISDIMAGRWRAP